jgi:putative ABC transport system ATP-binding protein
MQTLLHPAVTTHALRKSFGSGEAHVEVLRGIEFEAALGELTFLVGPSGCGKTTLISVIAGLLDADSGDLTVLERRTAELTPAERVSFRRANLGFVFQQYNLLPALTARENASVPLIIAGQPRREALEKAEAILVQLGMQERLHAMPVTLSGGQQQRVALARALVHQPRLVVCDEPTAALDHATGDAVMQLLRSTAVRSDRAVIVVTHDTRVFRYADRIAEMDDGRIVRTHVPKEETP